MSQLEFTCTLLVPYLCLGVRELMAIVSPSVVTQLADLLNTHMIFQPLLSAELLPCTSSPDFVQSVRNLARPPTEAGNWSLSRKIFLGAVETLSARLAREAEELSRALTAEMKGEREGIFVCSVKSCLSLLEQFPGFLHASRLSRTALDQLQMEAMQMLPRCAPTLAQGAHELSTTFVCKLSFQDAVGLREAPSRWYSAAARPWRRAPPNGDEQARYMCAHLYMGVCALGVLRASAKVRWPTLRLHSLCSICLNVCCGLGATEKTGATPDKKKTRPTRNAAAPVLTLHMSIAFVPA